MVVKSVWDTETNEKKETAHNVLLRWLVTGKNFRRYKDDNKDGATKTTIVEEIRRYLVANGITKRNNKSILNKIECMLKKYQEALSWLMATGPSIRKTIYISNDQVANNARQGSEIKRNVTAICPEFYDIDRLYDDYAGAAPPFPSEDADDDMVGAILGLDKGKNEALERKLFKLNTNASSHVEDVQTRSNLHSSQSTRKPYKKRSKCDDVMDSIMELSEKRIRIECEKLKWEIKRDTERLEREKKKHTMELEIKSLGYFTSLSEDVDNLHRSGILTDEEYRKQKLEIFKLKLDNAKTFLALTE